MRAAVGSWVTFRQGQWGHLIYFVNSVDSLNTAPIARPSEGSMPIASTTSAAVRAPNRRDLGRFSPTRSHVDRYFWVATTRTIDRCDRDALGVLEKQFWDDTASVLARSSIPSLQLGSQPAQYQGGAGVPTTTHTAPSWSATRPHRKPQPPSQEAQTTGHKMEHL